MATHSIPAETTLRIRRTFAAPREKVFGAWTDAKALKAWFAPSDQFVTRVPELDVRVGGRYRVEMEMAGSVHTVVGTYHEVRRPERLVFTWRWETEPQHGETLVTIELFERDEKTEMVLTHQKFPTDVAREEHSKGWTGCLARLEGFLGLARQ